MNLFKAIQLQALLAVIKPDDAAETRKIVRWFSKTFHTPIAQVEEMPFEDVLQVYYEEKFEEMSEDDLEKVKTELLESPLEKATRLKAEDAERADADLFAKLVEAEEKTKKAKKTEGGLPIVEKQSTITPVAPPRTRFEKETVFPGIKEIPPDIQVVFDVDEDEFARDAEGMGTMTQPEPHKKK